MSGAVRSTGLSAAIGRSVLDLPVDADRSVLDCWRLQVAAMVDRLNVDDLVIRVMINRQSYRPTVRPNDDRITVRVEEDASEFRGTAGVLRDLAQDYEDDDMLLVANGAQIMLDPLDAVLEAMVRTRADVSVVSHDDGTPSGMMLVRCGVLDPIPQIGFIDMKEQALPKIAEQHLVTVVKRRYAVGLPIRGLADYVLALRRSHSRDRQGGQNEPDSFAEVWQPTFQLVEPDAHVDDTANVHDSVVLGGARVERGAVIVQSVVCPGAVVRRNQTVTDRLVEAPRRRGRGEPGA